MLAHRRLIPSQLKTAARFLNKTISQFPGKQINIYGHSLGAINAQFALANCHHPERQLQLHFCMKGPISGYC